MIPNPVEHHISTFLRALTLEVTHALGRTIRTGLVSFFVVLIAGGILLTAFILGVGKTPLNPLAELNYLLLLIAALATGVAAASLRLSVAVLQAIERASKRVTEDIEQIEGKAVHTLLEAAHLMPTADQVDGATRHQA